ncbi:MAG TPA: 50S ribosomal protein L20, partial [Nitrospirae bacterium]|nr:50S ribosomal protein L20 [Nitrospirota bacterium]HEW81449.1 50S ribosomal protein L20 [Nitrospirota bacterium]
MPRVRGGFKTRRRRKKVLKLAKGFYGARSKLYKVATQAVDKAL